MLSAYFAMARAQIESHGGVVEKFIGDAVVGVFGVPGRPRGRPRAGGARGDSGSSRTPRTCRPSAGRRCGCGSGSTPGEALVRLGITPGSGSGILAGDAINTASRIQSVAPEMGVAVGLATYEATSAVFDYEELEPATLKGKAEPVRVFHAKAPRARFGTDLTRTHDTPFVGREIDLALLKGIFDKTRRRRARCSSSPWSASPASARAGSSPSSSPTSTPDPSSPPGARAGACPTARASRSGRSGRS